MPEEENKCKIIISAQCVIIKNTMMKNMIKTKTKEGFKQDYQIWFKNVKQVLEQKS